MEKLNEVAAFLDRNPGLADCVVQITYSEMYDIAEAFRGLEQRAEAAEAKLAELEKQEPYGYVVITGSGAKKFSTRHPRLRVTNEPPVAVFTRPAPAADLAELVPDVEPYCNGLWPYGVKALEDYRAAILRNIEEAK